MHCQAPGSRGRSAAGVNPASDIEGKGLYCHSSIDIHGRFRSVGAQGVARRKRYLLCDDMAASPATQQAVLEAAWTKSRGGTLPAWEEAKAWAFREVWRSEYETEYGLLAYVAGKVVKTGGGHPSPAAICKLYATIDADPSWFPGKSSQERHGPAPVLTGVKRACIARSAMTMKQKGVLPKGKRIARTYVQFLFKELL